MDAIKMARELGKAIQADERFKRMMEIQKVTEQDKELQEKIGKFNLIRVSINEEVMKDASEKDENKLDELNSELQNVYEGIMGNPNMIAFNAAKEEMDKMITFVNDIVMGSLNGEDPDSIEEKHACSGSCSSCGGCH